MDEKPVEWVGSSREAISTLPPDARHMLGFELGRIQRGYKPSHWRPMPSVGAGAEEIRVRVHGAFRLLYIAKFNEAIYVLHSFEKKSQQTSSLDIELARARYRSVIRARHTRALL